MFYAHVDLILFNYVHLCCLCGFELFSAQNITWQELIIASNKIYRCPRLHGNKPLSPYKYHYLSTTLTEKDGTLCTYPIDIKVISNLQGHFNAQELKCCFCFRSSFLVTDKYPACCVDCGEWCKIKGEPNRSRHLSFDNFREIYSASKKERQNMEEQDPKSLILIPKPFLRDW